MRRFLPLLAAAALLAAVLLAPAASAAPAALTPTERQQIGLLIDRFVKDAVRREDLAEAWQLAGPGLRGGTTRAGWMSGKAVTVEQFPARGNDFTHAWTAVPVGPGDAVVSLMFHADAAHPTMPQTAFKAEVVRQGGRWIVNGWYPAATFFGGGHVEGPADFGARGGGGTEAASGRIGASSFGLALAAIGAVIVLVPLGFWVRAKRRDRRAYAAYLASQR